MRRPASSPFLPADSRLRSLAPLATLLVLAFALLASGCRQNPPDPSAANGQRRQSAQTPPRAAGGGTQAAPPQANPQAAGGQQAPSEKQPEGTLLPLVLKLSRTAEKPNITTFLIVNQTGRTATIRPEFFALILHGERQPHIYQPGRDFAQLPPFIGPNSEGAGRIEWGGVPPLAGQRLVFNPEPLGYKPTFQVIEPNEIVATP